MLPGTRLTDDARLAHALGQQSLRQRAIDLVGARVCQVLALEPNLRAANAGGKPLGVIQRRGPTDVVAQEVAKRGVERVVLPNPLVGCRQLFQRRHQRLRHKLPAVGAETSRRSGLGPRYLRRHCRHCHRTLPVTPVSFSHSRDKRESVTPPPAPRRQRP